MTRTTPLLAIASLLLACLAGSLPAQCQDPTPPREGFTPKFVPNQPITYSDSYKTLANVLYPDAAPSTCGWPLLVLVHGLSGSRNTSSLEAYALVTQGFFVVTYDVRGQGDTRTLNAKPASKLWSLDEWIDLAEVIEWCGRTFPGRVDLDRVGVFGDSQGAVHAWAAAAWSGKTLPTNTRRTKAFPKIRCVAPRYFDPHVVDSFALDGSAFLYYVAGFGYTVPNPIVDLDPVFRSKITSSIGSADASELATYLRSVPGFDFVALLEKTEVPILTFAGWQDTWSDPRGVLSLLDRLPATTQRRCYLTTGPHGMPINANQLARQVFLTEGWFKRWLKADPEPVEKGPPFTVALMPSDNTDYLSLTSLWRHRKSSVWPPKKAVASRYHLRSLSRLSEVAPGMGEGESTIQHTVSPSYGPAAFVADDGDVTKVSAKIPHRQASFTTTPFLADVEFACLPKISLAVESTARRIVLGARLSVVDGSSVRVLASGGLGIEFSSVPSNKQVDLELSPLATIIKAGQRLRLEISNFDLQTPDTKTVFRRLPSFSDFTARIRHNSVDVSWMELRRLPRVEPSITSADTTISVTNPQAKKFQIRSSSEWKNAFYVVLLGFVGEGPPKVFPNGTELWMVPDPTTLLFASTINLPLLSNFGGVLDANGEAECTLNLGLIASKIPPSIVGLNITIAPTFFTFERGFEGGHTCRLRFR